MFGVRSHRRGLGNERQTERTRVGPTSTVTGMFTYRTAINVSSASALAHEPTRPARKRRSRWSKQQRVVRVRLDMVTHRDDTEVVTTRS